MKKNVFKKLCAQTIALSMVASLCACGSNAPEVEVTADTETEAAETLLAGANNSAKDSSTKEIAKSTVDLETATAYPFEEEGVTLYLPPEYIDTKGVITYSASDITSGDGVYVISARYCGMTQDDIDALMDKDDRTEDEVNKYYNSFLTLFEFVGIDKNRKAKDIVDIVNAQLAEFGEDDSQGVKEDELVEMGTFEDCTYYYAAIPEEYTDSSKLDPEFKEEYDMLYSYVESILENAEYSKALGMFPGVVGSKLSFETTDIDGNVVNSEDLFAEHDITMVNVWATWCGWCVQELPELEEINKRLADKNCAIVGLLGDGTDDDTIAEGKSLLEESGCTYTNILPYDNWSDSFDMSEGWPTSFLVDSTGTIVAIPIVGAQIGNYENAIDKALAGEDQDAHDNATSKSTENNEGVYRIIVVDEESNPVEGAMIQFCSGDTCNMSQTDKDGIAIFDKPEDVYQVHVLKVPKGYKADDDLYLTDNTFSDLIIVLDKE